MSNYLDIRNAQCLKAWRRKWLEEVQYPDIRRWRGYDLYLRRRILATHWINAQEERRVAEAIKNGGDRIVRFPRHKTFWT